MGHPGWYLIAYEGAPIPANRFLLFINLVQDSISCFFLWVLAEGLYYKWMSCKITPMFNKCCKRDQFLHLFGLALSKLFYVMKA